MKQEAKSKRLRILLLTVTIVILISLFLLKAGTVSSAYSPPSVKCLKTSDVNGIEDSEKTGSTPAEACGAAVADWSTRCEAAVKKCEGNCKPKSKCQAISNEPSPTTHLKKNTGDDCIKKVTVKL